MGFAVVADEVRNLAQRCADAASLIGDSIGKSRYGKARLDEVAVTFRSILDNSRDLATFRRESDILKLLG
jgi:methyl-accepting chemotaxis protein